MPNKNRNKRNKSAYDRLPATNKNVKKGASRLMMRVKNMTTFKLM
jgi:hypothetical protein